MRNKLLAIAAIGGYLVAPFAAQAQGVTTGMVRGGQVIVTDEEGIAVDQRPAFREYIVRERVPNYTCLLYTSGRLLSWNRPGG